MREFEELRIRIWKTVDGEKLGCRDDRYVVITSGVRSAVGTIAIDREAPVNLWTELDDIFQQVFDPGHLRFSAAPEPKAKLSKLGERVFEALLKPAAGAIHGGFDATTRRGRGFRLRLMAPDLLSVPFEAVRVPRQDLGYLSLKVAVVRSLPGAPGHALRMPSAAEPRAPMDLLIVASSAHPPGHQPIDAAAEIGAINAAGLEVQRGDTARLHVLGSPAGPANRATFDSVGVVLGGLKGPCTVLFIAHGCRDQQGEVSLLLEKADGSADPVSSARLRTLLERAAGLRLVVLNLCLGSVAEPGEPYSGLAQGLIAAGIPAVVAMQAEVTNVAATPFSPALLKELWKNETIDDAVLAGRQAMQGTQTKVEWCNPILFLHESCRCGWLFKTPVVGRADDFYQDAQRALAKVDPGKNRKAIQQRAVPDLLKAVRSARALGQWSDVEKYASIVLGFDPVNAEAIAATDEALLELNAAAIADICRLLLVGDLRAVQSAKQALLGIENRLPRDTFRLLELEVESAAVYRQARQADDRTWWREASDAYAKLPAEYLDVAARRAYCDARVLESGTHWESALEIYARLGEFRDAERRQAYAAARAEEDAGHWKEAAAAYERLLGEDDGS
jgi:hypothetical protein